MGFENGLNFKDMLGGLENLIDEDTLNRLTGEDAPLIDDSVTENNVMLMLNGVLSDENNQGAIKKLIEKIKPLLDDKEKSVLEKGEPADGLRNLMEELKKNPQKIKKLAGILFENFNK